MRSLHTTTIGEKPPLSTTGENPMQQQRPSTAGKKSVLDGRYVNSFKHFQNTVRWFYYHPYFTENRAQRSHVPNLSMVTQLESCRTGTEPRLEPVYCWAILLLSVVVAQQLASLPRVNTSCLLHRNWTKLLTVIRCFLVHRFPSKYF